LGEQTDHLDLSLRQLGGVTGGRRAWPSGQAAGAALAQAASNERSGRSRFHPLELFQSITLQVVILDIKYSNRSFIWTAKLEPQLCRGARVPGQF
jgi:hypothetical protein